MSIIGNYNKVYIIECGYINITGSYNEIIFVGEDTRKDVYGERNKTKIISPKEFDDLNINIE